MPSLRQLAKLAGVAASTMSRALRDDPQISPATRQRLQELVELYRYRPNRLTQSLVSGKSSSIGFLMPSVRSIFFSQVLEGVLERAFSESIHVIPLGALGHMVRCYKALQTFIELRVEGILLATGNVTPLTKSSILEIWSHGIPTVRIGDTPVEASMDQVTPDEEQAAELAVDYLSALGHREIAYLGFYPSSRADAVQYALRRRGLTTIYHRSDIGEEAALAPTWNAWRKRSKVPTAILTYNDPIAALLLQIVTSQGIRVPQELSVMGGGAYDYLSPFLIPPLTTMQHDGSSLGQRAFDLLYQRIQSGNTSGTLQPERITIPATLIKRASCAAPRH